MPQGGTERPPFPCVHCRKGWNGPCRPSTGREGGRADRPGRDFTGGGHHVTAVWLIVSNPCGLEGFITCAVPTTTGTAPQLLLGPFVVPHSLHDPRLHFRTLTCSGGDAGGPARTPHLLLGAIERMSLPAPCPVTTEVSLEA